MSSCSSCLDKWDGGHGSCCFVTESEEIVQWSSIMMQDTQMLGAWLGDELEACAFAIATDSQGEG